MNDEIVSKISEFIIYYIMYIFACLVGTFFIDYSIQKELLLNFGVFKIHAALLLDIIFIALIVILFVENFKFKQYVAKFLYDVLSFRRELDKKVETGLGYFFNIIMLFPLLATSYSYASVIIGTWGILVVVFIFIFLFYYILQFLKSWDKEIEYVISMFYKKLKHDNKK